MLFRELCSLFFRWNRCNRKPRTVEFYQAHLGKFLAAHGHEEAGELRPYHVLELKSSWHVVMSIQRLYRWAVEEADILPGNPMAKLKRPKLGARKRILSGPEMSRLLRCARPDFRRFLLAMRETAARPQEVRELLWEDLHWDGGFKELEQALRTGQAFFLLVEYKGRSRRSDPGEARCIPVSPRLGRLLWRMVQGRALSGRIFQTDLGRDWSRNSLRLRMRRLRQKVNIPEEVHGEKICCYHMRHSKATDLADKGMQTSVLQLLLGHSNIRTTQRYLHFHRALLMGAWKRFHEGRN
jgi:integrase